MGQGEHRGIALGGPRQGGPGTAATGLRWGARGVMAPEVRCTAATALRWGARGATGPEVGAWGVHRTSEEARGTRAAAAVSPGTFQTLLVSPRQREGLGVVAARRPLPLPPGLVSHAQG